MQKLKLKTILGFAVGDLGGNLYFSIIGFIFIFYLTEQHGISGTLAGSAMLIGKLWDAITDPVISSLSDRSKSKWGRRRPFIFWGALLLFISVVLLFSIPTMDSSLKTFLVASALFCLTNTAYTLVNIPYAALQPELTNDYHEKTRLTGFRMAFAIFGTILAVCARPIAEGFGFQNNGWTLMAIIMGLTMLISSWVTVFTVKEPDSKSYKKQKELRTSYKEAFTNKEFIPALIAWSLFIAGVTIIQQGFAYYYKYIYRVSDYFEKTLFGLIFISLISLPLWVKISKKISKGYCYQVGMSIVVIALVLSFFITPFTTPLFTLIALTISGIGFSTHYVMPHSIIPDIIELDAERTGIRREGIYIGIWNFLMKCGQALAGLIIGLSLDLFNFIPPENPDQFVEQSKETLNGIAILCGPIPIIIIIIGIIILRKYPITHKYYLDQMDKEKRVNEAY